MKEFKAVVAGLDGQINDKNNMLISIIIPSKNRHTQLMETLRAHEAFASSEYVEIVIADNSSVCLPESSMNELKSLFRNLVYQNDPEFKSIISNFNFGLSMATGEFSIFIGDDDFVLPDIIDAAVMANANGIDCVIYEPDKYYWKSCVFAVKSDIGPGCLIKGAAQNGRYIDPDVELAKSARNGFLTIESLPRAYHGMVRRTAMLQLSGDPMHPIVGGSPDISMAVALALRGIKTYFWPSPLSVYGASTGSGGGMTTSRSHLLQLNQATFLETDFVSKWSKVIPAYWSEYTVFPASALYVHAYFNKLPARFNLARVYASILVNERSMSIDVLTTFSKLSGSEKWNVVRKAPAAFARKLAGAITRAPILAKVRGPVVSRIVTKDVNPSEILRSYHNVGYES